MTRRSHTLYRAVRSLRNRLKNSRVRRTAGVFVDRARGMMLRARLRWRPVTHEGPSGANGPCRVLVVDDMLPDPLFGAGYPRAAAIIRSLVAAGHVVDHYPMQASRSDLRRMTVLFGNDVQFHPGSGAAGLARLLWRDSGRFDVLFVSRPVPMAAMTEALLHPLVVRRAPVVYDAEAVLAPREQQRRALLRTPWSSEEYVHALEAELALAQNAGIVTAVGRGDAETIASIVAAPVFVLAHSIVARPSARGSEGRTDLLFVGRLTGSSEINPNVDSVCWFVSEVMPLIDRLIGDDYRLHVIGKVKSSEIAALASDRVLLHGVVDDLQPFYDRCRMLVAPTRFAAGIPLKVIEALGEGLPCVVTSRLADQLGVSKDVLAIGSDAQNFASHCAQLYHDDELWRARQQAGLAHVDLTYSAAAFDRTLADVIDGARRIGATTAGWSMT